MVDLDKMLKTHFGYNAFRVGQKEIIEDVLAKKDVLATLPTGSGKSILYQLPALIFDGPVIVISPLISLMEDQVKQLRKIGIKQAVALNSFNSPKERQAILDRLNDYKLIYLSPEILQNQLVMRKLKQLTIQLFVVDEAHCLSQWGHEFRPDYLKLNPSIIELGQPPILALTATATEDVQRDIVNHFNQTEFIKHIYPIDRKNISLVVERVSTRKEKDDFLINLFKTKPVPAIIYFSSKKETERVAELLSQELGDLNIAYYHSGVDDHERILIQEQFIENQIDIICSTSAFGMGIDKENIRLIIHYHLPTQLESFIQEIGRAGRDQLSSVSITLLGANDQELPMYLINSELPPVEVIDYLFSYLEQVKKNQTSPVLKQVLQEVCWELNEIQTRYIMEFFKEFNLVNHAGQVEVINPSEQVREKLNKRIDERYRYKQEKFTELLNWLNNPGCRRVHLYQPFQSTVTKVKEKCCDHCGFKLEDWSPRHISRRTKGSDLSEALRAIMLPFEVREAQ